MGYGAGGGGDVGGGLAVFGSFPIFGDFGGWRVDWDFSDILGVGIAHGTPILRVGGQSGHGDGWGGTAEQFYRGSNSARTSRIAQTFVFRARGKARAGCSGGIGKQTGGFGVDNLLQAFASVVHGLYNSSLERIYIKVLCSMTIRKSYFRAPEDKNQDQKDFRVLSLRFFSSVSGSFFGGILAPPFSLTTIFSCLSSFFHGRFGSQA